jgi:hypothetical protein
MASDERPSLGFLLPGSAEALNRAALDEPREAQPATPKDGSRGKH